MTTAEAAADVQVPEIGEHSPPGDAGAENSDANVAPAKPTTFTFTPEGPEFGPPTGMPSVRHEVDYGGPIVVPNKDAIVAPGTERWFFRQFHKVQEQVQAGQASSLQLAFFWLEHAGVSESVIDRVSLLSAEEWERFYRGWMSGAVDSNLGE